MPTENNNIKVLLFYKYVFIENPKKFAGMHFSECQNLGIRGRILVAEEGINGSISGTQAQCEKYKKILLSDEKFRDIEFKEENALMHPFNRFKVKVKNEIVRFGKKVDLKKTGEYISPKEFLDIYENGEIESGETLILDARNDYENRVGKFKHSINLRIKTFREFADKIDDLKGRKTKKIVMYCTGGIRCEKASAYMKEIGFNNVYQLKGGILNFGRQCPGSAWEGKCFVFDKRLLSSINSKEKAISKCQICNITCDLYKNCAYKDCDDLCIVCLDCEKKFGGCCSKNCFDIMQLSTRRLNVASL